MARFSWKAAATGLGAILFATSAAMANPYAEHEGTTIVVSWPALAHFNAAEELVEEFIEETGINVEIDSLQYLALRDRQLLEMSKPEGEYDVVSWVVMWKGEYVSKGLLTPLSEFFTNASLVDPMYDIRDIAEPEYGRPVTIDLNVPGNFGRDLESQVDGARQLCLLVEDLKIVQQLLHIELVLRKHHAAGFDL